MTSYACERTHAQHEEEMNIDNPRGMRRYIEIGSDREGSKGFPYIFYGYLIIYVVINICVCLVYISNRNSKYGVNSFI